MDAEVIRLPYTDEQIRLRSERAQELLAWRQAQDIVRRTKAAQRIMANGGPVMAAVPAPRQPIEDMWDCSPPPASEELAKCKDMDGDEFFKEFKGRNAAKEEREYAAKLCSGCPIIASCLEKALKRGDKGIRGGLSEFDRKKLAKKAS